MLENEERIGSFTNSKIFELMKIKKDGGFMAGALTYIKEKQLEKRMGRCLSVEKYARPMAWGHFMERHVHSLLGIEYLYICKGTKKHPSIEGWSGSTDFIVPNERVVELKCFEPKKFGKYTDAILTKNPQIIKEECPEEYWQLVGNAIINELDHAEAITFMPYRSELEGLREMARNYDCPESELWKYRFISEGNDMSLAHLPDGGYYKSLNRFLFEVPQIDKIALTDNVMKGLELLNEK